MGYSIAVICKDKETQQKMFQFLKKNYVSWSKLTKEKNEYSSDPTDDLSYSRKKNQIGFDYGPIMGGERNYKYCLVYWIAIRTCNRKLFKNCDVPLNWYLYDGYEPVPIILKGEKVPKEKIENNGVCDYDGFKKIGGFEKIMNPVKYVIYNSLIKKELQRLSKLWKEEK